MSQNEHLPEALYDYILRHNPPIDARTQALIDETAAMGRIRSMQLGIDQAMFLGFLVRLTGARFVVEVGTFTGLSAMLMARALPEGGRLLCCDVNEEFTAIARRYWEEDGVAGRIELVIAPASETLAALPEEPAIDMAFVDADKGGYLEYYEQIVPRLSPGGLFVADNMFYGGSVVEPAGNPDAEALRSFAEHIQADSRTEALIVSIGDGFGMARRA